MVNAEINRYSGRSNSWIGALVRRTFDVTFTTGFAVIQLAPPCGDPGSRTSRFVAASLLSFAMRRVCGVRIE